ncbi:acetyl-CoA hydrolase/transferase family protein [Spongiibacter tropicus]|uniref:acetyl-CoA hydrolase/transferase family protein n=1 Tax=Spongiibacter tropicus TaxID=454602 RepID=UPI003A992C98
MTELCNTAQDALNILKSGDTLWCHSMAATPYRLLEALAEKALSLQDLTLMQLHLEHADALCAASLDGHLRNRCFFVGKEMREMVNNGRADYVPIFLSEIPRLFRQKVQPVDVALIQVSPPDRHGNCSLGVSVEATRAACDVAKTIIAQINPRMPRTHGDACIPYCDIDYAVEIDSALPEHPPSTLNEVHLRIGRHVAELVENGDCLQTGIGAIPDAALHFLQQHDNLGIHTEMFADGILPLIERGVITNRNKVVQRGKLVTGFVLGSNALYDFVDDNTDIAFTDIEEVNNPAVIRKNPQAVSINSAIQIDLSGQVCADSIGSRIYSGFGGQVDFVTGAQLSKGGRSIIALPATAAGGTVSRLVTQLSPGAGVVTSRAQIDHVVTEFGVASLRGCSLRERARALIAIAHPDFQDPLHRQCFDAGLRL